MSSTDKILTDISGKMDKMLRLLASNTVKGLEKEQDKIDLLGSLGFRTIGIARLLNKSPENVRTVLSKTRRKSGEEYPTDASTIRTKELTRNE
jgi:hypothetical protein